MSRIHSSRKTPVTLALQYQAAQYTRTRHPERPSVACHTATLDAPTQTQEHQAQEEATFDWAKQWYPVAFVDDLDPTKPHSIELLGKRLVLWRDAEKRWRTFEDKCPHRLAPLSEGRIEPEDGTLMCSYHGWRFQGDGACTKVPQALDEKANAAACSNSRSSAVSHPTQVRQGYVHVWGDGSPAAFIDAAAKPPMLVPELDPEAESAVLRDGTEPLNAGKRYLRDLPYGWDFLVENLMDPSHVAFSHHGILGKRDAPGVGHYEMTPTPESSPIRKLGQAQDSVSLEVTSRGMGRPFTYSVQFVAPCLVRYYMPGFMGGEYAQMWMIATPTKPGWCRCLWWFFAPAQTASKRTKTLARLPTWLDHQTRSAVFDGDNVFLHGADRIAHDLEESTGSKWKGAYFMPAQADRTVTEFRRWLDKRGQGGPTPGHPGPILEDRRVLLDRYEQHVKHCNACQKAMSVFKALRVAAVVVAAAALLTASGLVGGGARLSSLPVVALGIVALACCAAWQKLSGQVEKFYFTDYKHSET
ncbi:g7603 [Coccomyxa viridis]|uniref:G7603 protein n=1 Tax=Coccomyxa viridis TaxID=1274662 RepID=A0ABP1G4U5_9CHLO